MRTLILRLIGTTPILLHHISRHQFREQLASHSGGQTIEEEALEVMVKDSEDSPSVPVSWIWDALKVGCSRITVEGKRFSYFSFQSEFILPLGTVPIRRTDGSIPEWKPYSSIQHAAPGSKESIVVVAPIFRDWMLTVAATVSESLDRNLLNKIFVEAGKVGIGLFHPPKKQFGQFRVGTIR